MNDGTSGLEHKATVVELLAPAGDRACLDAALDGGADAVYLGMRTLNARRGARNFLPDELADAVAAAHQRGARVYLTLNIDLTEREVGQAARILELARQCGVDGVLARDAALVSLLPHFPELAFHFSTQTCVANSADAAAAARLKVARVVLAREMSLGEIAAASAVPGVQTEVFVQGAMCFSVSGRCLLSSWAGGHSGNRGTCTSTCRVPWSLDGKRAEPLFSMRDLSAVDRLDELRRAGVAAVKIEGRLKSPDWVGRAVGLYRKALDGVSVDAEAAPPIQPLQLREAAAALGDYTGRTMTSGYLDGHRDELTGLSGRTPRAEPAGAEIPSAAEPISRRDDADEEDAVDAVDADDADDDRPGRTFDLEILTAGRAIECRFRAGLYESRWTMPKTVVRRAHKAVPVGHFLTWLAEQDVQGYALGDGATDQPEFLLVPRAANALMDRIQAAVRLAGKSPDAAVRVDLPEAVRQALEKGAPHALNRRALGDAPDRVRLASESASAFLKHVHPEAAILEGVSLRAIAHLAEACGATRPIVALPPVFFEGEVKETARLLERCAEARITVEVNSWGGWRLAEEAGVTMEAGPGLGVLNSLAARTLRGLGMRGVTASIEADRRQLEDLAACCPAPLSIMVFGRPVLATTRVEFNSGKFLGATLEDRRGVRLVPRRERGLWVFRPDEPFDWRGLANPRIVAAHLVVDLVASHDPLADWYAEPEEDDAPLAFNYARTLV